MRIRFLHMVAVLTLMAVFSCRKETSIEQVNPRGTFVATIDGVEWAAGDSLRSATMLAGIINITGISVDNKQMSITLNDTIAGVYTLNQGSTSLAAYGSIDSSDLYAYFTNQGTDTSQAGGTVTVTEIDRVNHTLSGNFSFKMYRDVDGRQKKVTDGFFYKIPYSSSLPPANTGDTIRASIDGQHWVAQSIAASSISNGLIISGSALTGAQAVSLYVPVNIQPGSYTLDYTGYTYFGLYNPVISAGYVSSSGTLVILENNVTTRRMRGNFQFHALDPTLQSLKTFEITEGYFSVTYQ